MSLLLGLLTWPLAPVRGMAWVAEQVLTEAERQWSGPDAVREALDQLEEARSSGQIGEEEARELEEALVQRLLDSGEWAP